MAHTFFVLKQPNVEDRLVVWDTRTLSVGRAPDNDLTLEDDEISRKHAQFEKTDSGVPTVGDYHTGNGTFVNGQRVGQSHQLSPGDVIAIGKLQMELVESEEHPAKRGLKLEYASQLKTVGMLPTGADPSSTMLGVADGLPAGGGDDFVIEHARVDGGNDLLLDDDFGFSEIEGGEMALELDDELLVEEPAAQPAAAAPPPLATTRPAAPAAPAPSAPATATAPAAPGAAAPPAPARPAPAVPSGPAQAPRAAAAPARPLPPAARAAPAAAAPAVDPDAQSSPDLDPVARLRRLKALVDEGLITDDEFQTKRAAILAEM